MKPAALLLLILLAGCDFLGGAGDIAFTTDRSTYAPGDSVTLVLENDTDQSLGYNLCVAALEAEDPEGWETVPEPGPSCYDVLYTLAPGDRATYRRSLPEGLPAGAYRYRHFVFYGDDGERRTIQTREFAVEAP